MFPGIGTVVNVAAVLLGTAMGVLLGNRLPQRTRELVTDALGLVTLLIAATSAMAVLDPDLSDAVGSSAPMLIVLGALLVGGIIGSLLRIEARVEGFGGWLQVRLQGEDSVDLGVLRPADPRNLETRGVRAPVGRAHQHVRRADRHRFRQ